MISRNNMEGKIKILYVEDEPNLGRIVGESLESRGFGVYRVDDGARVMKEFRTAAPDICVLDVMLPGTDGFTLAREIRKFNPEIPIIFLTARIQTSDLLEGFEAGGNDYIRKPFSMEELIVRINNLLRLTRQDERGGREEIRIGPYLFLPRRFELQRGEKSWKLSSREAGLLDMLYRQRNATLLRKDILMNLWGDDSVFNSRSLDVYITRLRKYFSDGKVRINTVKGIGYNFIFEP